MYWLTDKFKAEAAKAAMKGILSNQWWMNKIIQEAQKSNGKEDVSSIVADYAVLFGDKLIERLEYPNSIKK